MGEIKFEKKTLVEAINTTLQETEQTAAEQSVATPGGRFHVRWDEGGSATALGQLPFFAEFLEVSGLFARWVDGCPMDYTSPNAPKVVDVLGTWLLSILNGQRRYAHVAGLRGDEVAPRILGMNKIISDESLRRALAHLAPAPCKYSSEEERAARAIQLAKSTAWMDKALGESTQESLRTPWILDAEVQSGKASAAKHSLPRLCQLIERLVPEERPALVRGDSAFGNQGVMAEMERTEQHYLFKLRQTAGVKCLIKRQWQQGDWQNAGQGFDAVEGKLRLTGWSSARRVVVLRRRIKDSMAAAETINESQQPALHFIDHSDKVKLWEYAILVTNTDYSLDAIGQLYRDRADCENGFDELKNQWGWGGYTTQDLERCNLSARAVALIYNWWSWYVRLAHPKTRLEAITSRPMLLSGIARLTQHAGQSRLLLTLTHAAGDHIKSMIANIRKGLDHVLANAPQLTKADRWGVLARYIINKIIATKPKNSQLLGFPPPSLPIGVT